MTLRYAHLAPSHKVKAVELLDAEMNREAIQDSVEDANVEKM